MSTQKGKLAKAAAAAAKNVIQKNFFRTEIKAQSASATPPLGPLLGNYGINIGNFCKDFNEKTKSIKKGIPLPVTIRVKPDRSYNIEIHTPPIDYLLKQAAGVEIGKIEGDEYGAAGKITIKHAYELAKLKNADESSELFVMDLEEVVKYVVGQAFLLGIEVVRDYDPKEYQEFLANRYAHIEEVSKQIEEEVKAKLLRT